MQKYPTQKLNQFQSSPRIQIYDLLTSKFQLPSVQWNIFAQINSKFKLQKIQHQEAAAIYSNLQVKEIKKNSSTKKNWKTQELHLLVFLIQKYCSINLIAKLNCFENWHWQQFSLYLPGRTAEQCKFKILSLTAETITSDPWTQEERNILTQLIQEQQMNWNIISQKLFQKSERRVFRTSKQCRQHYMCFLKPNLKKGVWTQEQDYKLICLFLQYGKKWSKIMKSLEGRNQNSIKNRFFLLFQNKSRAINNSDLIRKVKRRKQKLQKTISVEQMEWKQKVTFSSKYSQSTEQSKQYSLIKSLIQIQEQVKKDNLNSEETKKSISQPMSNEQNTLNRQRNEIQMQMEEQDNQRLSFQNINMGAIGYDNSFLYQSILSEELIFQSFEQYISF